MLQKSILLFFLGLIISGCAFFLKNDRVIHAGNEYQRQAICINRELLNASEMPIQDASFIPKDVEEEVLKTLKNRYNFLQFNCAENRKFFLVFSEIQEKPGGDYFTLSLGLIPLILKTTYVLEVFDENKSIYKAVEDGNVIASVFVVPLFFLNKSKSEIFAEMGDDFLSRFRAD